MQRAVALQQQFRRPGQLVLNALQTNDVLLGDAWGRFLLDNDFLVGVDLDGPDELHDVYRRDKDRHPTVAHVVAGIDILRAHRVPFSILTCVNDRNVQQSLTIYRFLSDDIGAEKIHFIPIVDPWTVGM